MNRTLIVAAVAAAFALPGLAQAHTTRGELRHDVRAVHQERHELAHAKRSHSPHKVREERREYNAAKRELRDDSRDFHRTHRP